MKFGSKFKKGASVALSLSMILSSTGNLGFINSIQAAEVSNVISQGDTKVTENTIFNELREKWDYLLVGGDQYDLNDSDVKNYVDAINKKAKDLYAKMFDPNHDETTHDPADGECECIFSDVPLTTDKATKDKLGKTYSSRITMTYDNLKAIALAYRTKGTEFYQNTEVRDNIIKALQIMNDNHYGVGTHRTSANWFDYDIGAPLRYLDTLTMMYDDLTDAQRTEFLSGVKNTIDRPKYDVNQYTGANMVWKQQVLTVYSILTGTLGANTENNEMIEEAKTRLAKMNKDIKVVFSFVTKGDGFYKDGSFVQHDWFPYTGGYGKALLVTMAPLMNLMKGSDWEIKYDDNAEKMFYDMLFEAYEPFIYKSLMMDMVRNREISRSCGEDNISGRQVIRSFIYMADVLEGEQKQKCLGLIKYWIENDPEKQLYIDPVFPNGGFVEYFVYMPVILKAKEIEKDSTVVATQPEAMHKRFSSMDRVVHRTDDFTAGLAMHSDRIATYEVTNTEGTNMWHTADGMLYVYNNDVKQYAEDFWGTVNHGRLPGTTVENKEKSSDYRASARNKYNWVGGTDIDGKYGVSGIHMNNDVDSKKSYFFFDDEIVAIGSNIKSNDGETGQVETIVDNKKLKDDKSNIIKINGQEYTGSDKEEEQKDVKYMHITGNVENSDTGYYFPKTENITALRETRTQSWLLMNNYEKFKDSVDRTKSFATFYINHGQSPQDASYEYVVLPSKSDEQTKQYSENPDIEILENSSDVHAVREKKLGITAVNFWEPTKSFAGITVDVPASVMTKDENGTWKISVADPTQKALTINVEVARPTKGLSGNENVTVLQTSPTTILQFNVEGLAGQTVEASLITDDIDNSFENAEVGSLPNGWSGEGTVVNNGSNGTSKALEVNGSVKTDISAIGNKSGFGIEFDFDGNSNVALTDSDDSAMLGLNIANGKISYNSEEIGTYSADSWNTIKLLVNTVSNNFTIYVNGQVAAKDKQLNAGSIASFKVSSTESAKIDNVFYEELDLTPIQKPTGFKCTEYGYNYITLSWDDLSTEDRKLHYKLYMNDNEPIETHSTNYTFENLEPSKEYKFKLIAIDTEGIGITSPESDVVTVTTREEPKPDFSETFNNYKLDASVAKGEVGSWTPTGNATDEQGTATIVKNPVEGSSETDYVLKAESLLTATERGAALVLPEELSRKTTFTFKLYLPKLAPYANFNLWDANGKQVLTLMLSTTGYFYKQGSTNSKDICKFYAGQWQEFKVVTDGENNKCDIYMNNELVAKDAPFRFDGTNKINKISVSSPKSGTGSIYLNDFSYTTSKSIESVGEVKSISALKDTPFSKLKLPKYVDVVFTNGSTGKVEVEWDGSTYVPSQLGQQALNGNLITSENIENASNLKAEITINVIEGTIGDVDGEPGITASDASLILQNTLKIEELDDVEKILADFDDDGIVTANDAALVLKNVINSNNL